MRKKIFIIISMVIILILIIISVYTGFKVKNNIIKEKEGEQGYKMANNKIQMRINNITFEIELDNNEVGKYLIEKLPLTIMMNELNGNEKYYYFDKDFEVKEEKIGQVEAGDIMLYGSNCLVLFYKSFKTNYTYTRVGKVTEVEGLKEVVSDDNIEVTFFQ